MLRLAIVLCLVSSAVLAKPLVIAHRGASGYLPEHTIEAYRLAIEMGADYIEPDLVSTKDGVLIARHENELSDTTDVAQKFPGRRTKRLIDGAEVEGWFSEDFTLAEIKTLRANERLKTRSQANNGKFAIPTFDEILTLVALEETKRKRTIGLYPETKHPSHFASRGLFLEDRLLRALTAANRNSATAAVFIQSFEVSNLKDLKTKTQVPLVQLLGGPDEQPYDQKLQGSVLTYGLMASEEGLSQIASYAKGVGPNKGYIILVDKDGRAAPASNFVARAHKAGLIVHPYTFRSDPEFLAKAYKNNPAAEYCAFFAAGVDGLFTDFPDTALKARDKSCEMAK